MLYDIATFVKRLNDVLSCVPRPQPPLKSNSLGWLTDKMCSISLTGELVSKWSSNEGEGL